jgi:hypothetical protein
MANKEGAQIDTLPSQQYGWDGSKPVKIGADVDGNLYTVDKYGMLIPRHDKIVVDESLAPATTLITYYLSDVERGVKTITVSGTTTTIEMTYV